MDSRVIDMAGKRFGRWTVLGQAKQPGYRAWTGAWWLCECDCGTIRVVNGQSLRCGTSRSCGCLRAEATRERFRRKREKKTGAGDPSSCERSSG